MNKLQLLGLKNNLKVLSLKRNYEKKYEDYKMFLANKKNIINSLNEKENQITKNKDNKIAFAVCIYIITFFLNILCFIGIFNILEISTMLNAIIISIIFNLGVGAPILAKNITSIIKREQKQIEAIQNSKQKLIDKENDLQNNLIKSLNRYSHAKEKYLGPKIKPSTKEYLHKYCKPKKRLRSSI